MSAETGARTGRTAGRTGSITGRAPGPREGRLAEFIGRSIERWHRVRERTAELVRGIRQVVTPVGWSLAAAALVSVLLWLAFGWVEALVLACGFAVLLVVAAAYLAGSGAAGLELGLAQERVAVGERAGGRLVSENPGRRRRAAVELEIPVGEAIVRRVLPALPAGAAVDLEFDIPTTRRGVVDVGPVRTVRADPIGLIRREIVWSGSALLHVHPRTVSIPALSTGFVRDLEGAPTRDLTASDIAFHALREYAPGDDRRHIHWKSSAKTGVFMVRQFEETRRSHLVVLLDADPLGFADDEEFELAVSVAGSLGVQAIRDARSVGVAVAGAPALVPGSALRELPTVSRDRLLDALCLVERDPRAVPLADASRIAAEAMPGISLAFLVTGTGRGAAALRAAAGRLPVGVEVIAVECAPEARPAVRAAGGLTVFTIGYLDDLRAMLARAASVA